MQLYRVHTNDGTRVVRSTPERLRAAMYAYIRAKRAEGMALAAIQFSWGPVRVSGTI